MHARRWLSTFCTVAFLTIAITHFQSCGEAYDPSFYNSDINGEVRIIDRWNDQQIEFTQSLVVVDEASESAEVLGLCMGQDNGEPLRWEIIEADVAHVLVDTGETPCERGEFRLDLNQVVQLKCDVEYQVHAQNSSGRQAATFVRRQCADSSI